MSAGNRRTGGGDEGKQSTKPMNCVPQVDMLAFLSMRRMQAILVVLAMLAAPMALLARAGACEQPCCATLCCASKHSAASQQASGKETGGMLCHRQGQAPSEPCIMKSGCNHALDYGFASPLPPTFLMAATVLIVPQLENEITGTAGISPQTGFALMPLQPPRS